MEGYVYHYNQAKEEFIRKFYNKHNPRHDWFNQCRSISMDLLDIVALDDEGQFALDSFDECQQVRIIYDYDIGQHCLKIKWEHAPWWETEVLHFYYCVMLPIDKIELMEPFALRIRELQK